MSFPTAPMLDEGYPQELMAACTFSVSSPPAFGAAIYNARNRSQMGFIRGWTGSAYAVAISPNGRLVAVGRYGAGGEATKLSVYNTVTRNLVADLNVSGFQNSSYPSGLAFSPDGDYLAAAGGYPAAPSNKPCVAIFSTDDWSRTIVDLLSGAVNGGAVSCAWSPDGSVLAIGMGKYSEPRTLVLLDGSDFSQLPDVSTMPGLDANGCFDVQINDQYLVAASLQAVTGDIRFWVYDRSDWSVRSWMSVTGTPNIGHICAICRSENIIATIYNSSNSVVISDLETLTTIATVPLGFTADGVGFMRFNSDDSLLLVVAVNGASVKGSWIRAADWSLSSQQDFPYAGFAFGPKRRT